MKILASAAILAVATTLTACASRDMAIDRTTHPKRGALVIAGGSVNPDNEGIYRAVLEKLPPDGSVVVLPTASGVPERSGPRTVDDFGPYIDNHTVELVEITHETPERAADPLFVDPIAAANAAYFTGGDQARILRAFRPDEGDTIGMEALRGILARGGVIGGTSAGAAMMSDPMIRGGTSRRALLAGVSDDDNRGVSIGRGMGFFPYGIVDQHFWERSRVGRLATALRVENIEWGFGVNENRALDADLATGTLRPVGGHQGVLVLDRRETEVEGRTQRNIRLHLLGDGDVLHVRTGELTLAPGRLPHAGSGESPPLDDDLWEGRGFKTFFRGFIDSADEQAEAVIDGLLHRFTRDEATVIAAPAGGGPETISALHVRWDIVETDAAETAADGLAEGVASNP